LLLTVTGKEQKTRVASMSREGRALLHRFLQASTAMQPVGG
jgi:site-specific recombinase XerD